MTLPDDGFGPSSVDPRDRLLAKLVLFSNEAIWPPAQVALLLHLGVRLAVPETAGLMNRDRASVLRLVERGRRRIKALGLVAEIATGRAWPDQLARVQRLITAIGDLAVSHTRRNLARAVEVARVAGYLTDYLVDHPLCGTPESHQLHHWIELNLHACLTLCRARDARPDQPRSRSLFPSHQIDSSDGAAGLRLMPG